jgi:hypothetical protein
MPSPTRNHIVNPCALVNQVVTAATLVQDTYVYGPDMFMAMATGTAVSAGTFGQTSAASVGSTGYAFTLAGVTLTGTGVLYVRHRMRSKDAVLLKNKACSLQVAVGHDVGSDVNHTLTVRKASAVDDFSTTAVIQAGSAMAVTTGTSSVIELKNIQMGDCGNGLEIELKIEPGAITANNFEITEWQLETARMCTPVAIASLGDTLAKCQRRYSTTYSDGVAPGTPTPWGSVGAVHCQTVNGSQTLHPGLDIAFPEEMDVIPAVTVYSSWTGTTGVIRNISTQADVALTSLSNTSTSHVGQLITVPVAAGNVCNAHFVFDCRI